MGKVGGRKDGKGGGKEGWERGGRKDEIYLVFIRYVAKLIDSGVPDITTVRSLDPSSVFEILILAPDSCL